jgi:putative flippase GtrA
MDTLNSGKIEKLLEDISSIKSVINKNKPLLQQVLNPAHFRLFTLLAAISIIGFALLIYFLMQHYGNFSDIPPPARYVIFAAMAADWFFMQYLKRRIFMTTGKRIDPTFTIRRLLKEFFTYRIAHVYVPVMVLIIFLIFYFIYENIPYYIVPAVSIGVGFLYNFIGSFTEIRQYLILGYWFLITGVGVIVFNNIPAPISLSITLGCGFLIFSALGCLSARVDKEE